MAKAPISKLTASGRRYATRRARHDGGPWTALAVVMFGARFLNKLTKREPEVVYRRELAPGETVTLRHTTESYRKLEKRQAAERKTVAGTAKAAKRQAKADRKARRS